jgi:hypothetical protein
VTFPNTGADQPVGLSIVQAELVNGTDPIFPSLWDATLSELGGETPVWEVFADAPNFLTGATLDVQALEAEEVLRRVRDEGWATFNRRALDSPHDSTPTLLSDDEIKDAIGRARTWFLTERTSNRAAVPEDLLPIFLNPTVQWLEWDATRRR